MFNTIHVANLHELGGGGLMPLFSKSPKVDLIQFNFVKSIEKLPFYAIKKSN